MGPDDRVAADAIGRIERADAESGFCTLRARHALIGRAAKACREGACVDDLDGGGAGEAATGQDVGAIVIAPDRCGEGRAGLTALKSGAQAPASCQRTGAIVIASDRSGRGRADLTFGPACGTGGSRLRGAAWRIGGAGLSALTRLDLELPLCRSRSELAAHNRFLSGGRRCVHIRSRQLHQQKGSSAGG